MKLTVASLIYCTDLQLGQFGEVGKVGEALSELGNIEKIYEPSTIKSNPSFTVRWTCLSLVVIRQMVMDEGNRIRELAGFAVSGIARFQSGYGSIDAAALNGVQRIEGYFRTAWKHVEDLHRALIPWVLKKTREDIRNILSDLELPISELERIESEANGIDDVDWRISLLQDAMDDATRKLMRRLPGVSINELKAYRPILISEAFDSTLLGSTPITPLFIFPGQQLRGLSAVGRGLRDILENRNPEKYVDTVKNLASIDDIPVPLRRLKGLATRQLWRLQDLRDGYGLGFTIELFFLALRQLSSAPLSPDVNHVLYTGNFNVIIYGWEKSRDSSGTQRILLDLICDIVIKGRGVFSDFSYPQDVVEMLLELVGNMIKSAESDAAHPHIYDALEELWNVSSKDRMDGGLWDKALEMLRLAGFSLLIISTG